MQENLKDKIDFVIWTGDSARHDNDGEIPRDVDQVAGLNQFMVDKMFETFGKHNGDEEDDDPNNDYVVPIIPNLGNNDVLPHNIFTKGPNKWTRTYAKVWKRFIPEAQKHQFEQGGWFYVEVIPKQLAVFSLNSLYFFTSNAAVNGCADPSEPGYQQLEWLRIQLQFMRERGIKAILTGHVPPIRVDTKTNWEESCWQKYTLWLQQYRDVIVSSHYGHFNYDHFILQDFEDIKKSTRKGKMKQMAAAKESGEDVHTSVSASYFIDLRRAWSGLPTPPKSLEWARKLKSSVLGLFKDDKQHRREVDEYREQVGGDFAERFSAAFVAASVVPNLYPSFRVFEYNITSVDPHAGSEMATGASLGEDYSEEDAEMLTKKKKKKGKKGKKKKKPRYKFEVPEAPSKSSPPGPAYSPQTFSLIKYTQYLANLTYINNDFHHLKGAEITSSPAKWSPGKHKGKKPGDDGEKPKPNKFEFEVEYDTHEDELYHLQDLTMPNLVHLAGQIGDCAGGEANSEDDVEDGEAGASDEELEEEDEDDLDAELKKKKKHKKKKKKKKEKKKHGRKHCKGGRQNETWFAFVRRAFVETLSREEIEDQFGD